MEKIGIATDSHSGISQEEAQRLGIMVLPMPFYFGEECLYEGVSITREDFFTRLKAGQKVSTSQPSPEAVMDLWREGLTRYEKLLYIPMSSGLSGSYSTAKMLAADEEFEGKVLVVDSGRAGTPLHRMVLDALQLVEEGCSAEEAFEILEENRDKMCIFIAVDTLEFLKRGGRVTPATAALGSLLNIKPILRFDVGILETYQKCRGMKKARREMLAAVKAEMEKKFSPEEIQNEMYILAASSADEATTNAWTEEIKEYFPGMEVQSEYLSLGLSCHIGPDGLGIAYSKKVSR